MIPARSANAPVRLTGFLLGLVLLFAVAYAAGGAVGTRFVGVTTSPIHQHIHQHGGPGSAAQSVGGLTVAENGYQLRRLSPDPVAGQLAQLVFQVIGPNGLPVTSFVNTHDKPLHLIIARRDLTGFQHLHPALDAGGTWQVPLLVTSAGDYRAITEFVPDNRTDTLVLGMDLMVSGVYRPVSLPPPATETTVDGYTVRMLDRPVAGEPQQLRFTISANGTPVTTLEPYLAAYGHLVALRQGDLGYLHVHPDGGPGVSPPGPEISFTVELPSAGSYRLYLDFAHHGAVRTAEFTVNAPESL